MPARNDYVLKVSTYLDFLKFTSKNVLLAAHKINHNDNYNFTGFAHPKKFEGMRGSLTSVEKLFYYKVK